MMGEEVSDPVQLGKELARAGRKQEAYRVLRRALFTSGDDPELRFWLGAVAPNPAEAVEHLQRCLELDPDNERARAGLTWALEQLAAWQKSRPAPEPEPPPAEATAQPLAPAPAFGFGALPVTGFDQQVDREIASPVAAQPRVEPPAPQFVPAGDHWPGIALPQHQALNSDVAQPPQSWPEASSFAEPTFLAAPAQLPDATEFWPDLAAFSNRVSPPAAMQPVAPVSAYPVSAEPPSAALASGPWAELSGVGGAPPISEATYGAPTQPASFASAPWAEVAGFGGAEPAAHLPAYVAPEAAVQSYLDQARAGNRLPSEPAHAGRAEQPQPAAARYAGQVGSALQRSPGQPTTQYPERPAPAHPHQPAPVEHSKTGTGPLRRPNLAAKQCASCDAPAKPEDRFCQQCGGSLQQQQAGHPLGLAMTSAGAPEHTAPAPQAEPVYEQHAVDGMDAPNVQVSSAPSKSRVPFAPEKVRHAKGSSGSRRPLLLALGAAVMLLFVAAGAILLMGGRPGPTAAPVAAHVRPTFTPDPMSPEMLAAATSTAVAVSQATATAAAEATAQAEANEFGRAMSSLLAQVDTEDGEFERTLMGFEQGVVEYGVAADKLGEITRQNDDFKRQLSKMYVPEPQRRQHGKVTTALGHRGEAVGSAGKLVDLLVQVSYGLQVVEEAQTKAQDAESRYNQSKDQKDYYAYLVAKREYDTAADQLSRLLTYTDQATKKFDKEWQDYRELLPAPDKSMQQ